MSYYLKRESYTHFNKEMCTFLKTPCGFKPESPLIPPKFYATGKKISILNRILISQSIVVQKR